MNTTLVAQPNRAQLTDDNPIYGLERFHFSPTRLSSL
jgi:hypothetical protein